MTKRDTRTRTISTTWKVLRWLPLLLLMANRPSCEGVPPNLTCDSTAVHVDLGSCTEITNPCGDGLWVRLDSFRLCDPPPGLSVRSERNPRARVLCASQAAPSQANLLVDFYYTTPSDSGEGTFFVTTSEGLNVIATATPDSIPVGGTSQLDAVLTGGVGPFTFSWFPSGSLDDPNLQNPIASPTNSTNYTVTVSDSNGLIVNASVTVAVNIAVSASANPTSINQGEQSQLDATVSGGAPPYTFSWSPVGSLDDFTLQNPVAQPSMSTNYTVIVTDALGAQGTAQAQVTVQSGGSLTAVLDLIEIAPVAVQPDGSNSTGPIQVYRFWCEWMGSGLPDFELDAASGGTDPTQLCAYDNPGLHTIRLEVADGLGNTDAATANFTSQ